MTPEHRQELGERLRQRRLELGLSQTALANKLPGSVDLNYVSRWERGVHRPSDAQLPHLAKALQVDVAWLEEAIRPNIDAPLTQLDRIERMLEAVLEVTRPSWLDEFRRELAPFEVIAGRAGTALPAERPDRDTPAREDERLARGRSRPRRAGTEPA